MPGLRSAESSADGTIEQLCQARHTPGVSLRFDRRCAPAVRGVAPVEMTDVPPRYTMGNGAGTGSRHERQRLRAVGTSSDNRPSDR
ncbi:protein of unknown function [Streptomyces murinus]